MDSMVNSSQYLKEYKKLDYCGRVKYIDSIMCNDKEALSKHYLTTAILDITVNAGLDAKMTNQDFGPIYYKKQDYFKVSDSCKEKYGCKTKKTNKDCYTDDYKTDFTMAGATDYSNKKVFKTDSVKVKDKILFKCVWYKDTLSVFDAKTKKSSREVFYNSKVRLLSTSGEKKQDYKLTLRTACEAEKNKESVLYVHEKAYKLTDGNAITFNSKCVGEIKMEPKALKEMSYEETMKEWRHGR
jgi:hypothetical protein